MEGEMRRFQIAVGGIDFILIWVSRPESIQLTTAVVTPLVTQLAVLSIWLSFPLIENIFIYVRK